MTPTPPIPPWPKRISYALGDLDLFHYALIAAYDAKLNMAVAVLKEIRDDPTCDAYDRQLCAKTIALIGPLPMQPPLPTPEGS